MAWSRCCPCKCSHLMMVNIVIAEQQWWMIKIIILCRNGRQHETWSRMINNSDSTYPWKCPHHSLGFHPLAVDHEKQKHEEHHEVEDQNEHRQPGRSEEKRVERGPKKEKEIPPEVAFSWPLSRSHALSLGKLKSDCQLCAHSFITSSLLLFLSPWSLQNYLTITQNCSLFQGNSSNYQL